MNNNTSNVRNAPKPIIPQDVADQLTDAYHTIYRLMASYGEVINTPVEQTGSKVWEATCARGFAALQARKAYLKEQEVAAFRQGVRDALEPHLDAARAEKEEYDAAKAAGGIVARMLPAFPTYRDVSIDDVSHVFPEGTAVEVQVKKLSDMGYKLVKSSKGAYSLRIDLPKSILGDKPAV